MIAAVIIVILVSIALVAWLVRRKIRELDVQHTQAALFRIDNDAGDALDQYALRQWLQERERVRERVLLGVANRFERRRWQNFNSAISQLRHKIATGVATEDDQVEWQRFQQEREQVRQHILTGTASRRDRRLWERWRKSG